MDLQGKIEDRSSVIGIIGLGYVGLPLAVAFAGEGFPVLGVDVDEKRVSAIMEGRSYIQDIDEETLGRAVREQGLRAVTGTAELEGADVIIICVPTPLRKTRDPDISMILEAVDGIVRILRPGQMVILESTSYPGTTREVILPELESTGLKIGEDFNLAFSPERIDPGNRDYTLRNTPKVVGGITDRCTELAAVLYHKVADEVVTVSSTDSAEMVKLLENTFRAVNIAMVNEMAIMCRRLGVDTWEIIQAAASKPFGFMPFRPGPGLGGHCIPVDPHYLSWKLRALNYTARFIELAGEINSQMPEHVLGLITAGLNDLGRSVKGSGILILGAAYKKDVSDVRESPALDIMERVISKGGEVLYHDPYVPEVRLDGTALHSRELDPALVSKADCVVIVTDHSCFDWKMIAAEAGLIIDTRNALGSVGIDDPGKIIKL